MRLGAAGKAVLLMAAETVEGTMDFADHLIEHYGGMVDNMVEAVKQLGNQLNHFNIDFS